MPPVINSATKLNKKLPHRNDVAPSCVTVGRRLINRIFLFVRACVRACLTAPTAVPTAALIAVTNAVPTILDTDRPDVLSPAVPTAMRLHKRYDVVPSGKRQQSISKNLPGRSTRACVRARR